MLALEKRMDGGNTAVHVNNQADLCDVLRTMETLVTECEKKYNSNENNRQPSKEDNTKKDPFHYSVSEV